MQNLETEDGLLSDQKVQRGPADFYAIAAPKRGWVARLAPNQVIDYGAVDRTEIFDHERLAFAPDARVTARDLCLRIEARQVNLGKNIGHWIGTAHEVTVLLQKERRVKLSRARDNELGRGPRRRQRQAGIAAR